MRGYIVSLLLIGALGLASSPQAGTPYASQVAPEPYASLLNSVVKKHPVNKGAFESSVDYAAVAAHKGEVRGLIESMTSVDPSSLGPKERLSWAVNLYNLLILDILSRHHQTVSSVSKIGDREFSIFDAPMISLGEKRYSLNEFERRFLFEGEDSDPRLHFAIVCGAKGCPPLWSEPLRPGTFDQQLELMVTNTLQNPRHAFVEGQTMKLSPLFDWYAEDFGREEGILEFLAAYLPDLPQNLKIQADLEWDWTLNARE